MRLRQPRVFGPLPRRLTKEFWFCAVLHLFVSCADSPVIASTAFDGCPPSAVAVQAGGSVRCVPDYPIWGPRVLNPSVYLSVAPSNVVVDSQSLLEWEASDVGALRWDDALEYCKQLRLAGRSDWRLPTVAEALSIADYSSLVAPALANAFPSISEQDVYWTAVWNVDGSAWGTTGGGANTKGKAELAKTRCVRGGLELKPAPRYVVSPDKQTVRDTMTNLLWQAGTTRGVVDSGSYGELDWAGAASACNNLGSHGRSWRLPSIVELAGIVDRSHSLPAFEAPTFGPSAALEIYWSSTIGGSSGLAWFVDSGFGSVRRALKSNLGFARCVTDQ